MLSASHCALGGKKNVKNDERGRAEIRAHEVPERESRPLGRATGHWQTAAAEIAREDAEATPTNMKKTADRKKSDKAKRASRGKKAASPPTNEKEAKDRKVAST